MKPSVAPQAGPGPKLFCIVSAHSMGHCQPPLRTRHLQEESPSDRHHHRRFLLGSAFAAAACAAQRPVLALVPTPSADLEASASAAYAERDFSSTLASLEELIRRDPTSLRLHEMRAQALVDAKDFGAATREFDECLRFVGKEPSIERARLLSGRGLALEGLSDWAGALENYTAALDMAVKLGADPDPYILNSRGNCHASLGEWATARSDFLASANGFQSARREKGAGSLQQRLDGAVFAFSNAALMLAQLGKDDEATKEMQSIARRAPGSADMRAALAAQLWAAGQEAEAESAWNFACSNITVGCTKYQDMDWLARIRRWPPVMVERLQAFLKLRSNAEKGIGGLARERATRRYSGFLE